MNLHVNKAAVLVLFGASFLLKCAAAPLPYPAPFMELPGVDGPEEQKPYFAYHPGDDLSVIADDSGTLFRRGEGSAFFRVTSVQRAEMGTPHPIGTFIRRTAQLNRLEIQRTHISERLETGPEGIKQTFIVENEPEGSGALQLMVALDGNYRIRETHPDRLFLDSPKENPMHYDGLHVYDAKGRVLPSRFVESGSERDFIIEVNDAGATYPVEIDPIFRPLRAEAGSRITETRPSDQMRIDDVGTVVRIAGDLVAVGVPGLDLYSNHQYDNLRNAGLNLAMTDRGGNIARAGALLQSGLAAIGLIDEPNVPDVGAVYVFGLIDGGWQLMEVLNDWATALNYDRQKYRPIRMDGGRFGASISLHGNSILVGAPGIKQETWVNVFIGQMKISGPNTAGGFYFFEMPSHGSGFIPRGRHYGLRYDFGYNLIEGDDRVDFREIGHVTAIDADRAVIASGPSYDPMELGGRHSGFGPSKLHHFSRNGITWNRVPHSVPDLRNNDFSGAVVGLHLEEDRVYVLEQESTTVRLWQYTWYPDANVVSPQLLHQWTAEPQVSFSAGDGFLLLGFAHSNRVQPIDLESPDSLPDPITLPPGATNGGKGIAHAGRLATVLMDLGGLEQIGLYSRNEESGQWVHLGLERSPFSYPIQSMDLDSSGLALIAPAADNSGHTDLRVLSLNRSISGTVRRSDGSPVPNFPVIASSEPTYITAHAATLFDGANFVPFETAPWTINRDWGCGLFFSVDDAFPFLDTFYLELTFTDIPPEMQGQFFVANVALPLQDYTWYGEDRYDTPGFGQGRGILQNGTVRVPLWSLGSFYRFAETNNISVVGEWQLRLAMGGPDRGVFNYATISSASLILQEANNTGYRNAFTDADGYFSLEGLPPGRYRAIPEDQYSWAMNYTGTTNTYDLKEDPIVTGAQLEITGAFSLRGTVRSLNGHSISGLPLELFERDGSLVTGSQVSSAPNGAYTMGNLVSGSYTIGTRSPWIKGNGAAYTESVYIRLPTSESHNVTDLIVPPMLDPPTVSVLTASGDPAANVAFTVTGPYGYSRSLTTNNVGQAVLPGWNSQHPYLYPGDYALKGTDERLDWSANDTRFTYPTGLDSEQNPLPVPPLTAIGSELTVTAYKGNQPIAGADILAARVTGTSSTTLEGVYGRNETSATRYPQALVLDLGSIELGAQAWDKAIGIEVWHYGGLDEIINNRISEEVSNMTYELVLPGGEIVELSTPIPEYSLYGTRKMTPVSPVSIWPGGRYQLRIRYDRPVFAVDVWNRWMIRVAVERRQVDNQRVGRSDSSGEVHLNDLPGGHYLFAPGLQDAEGNWLPANGVENGHWSYSLDPVALASGSSDLQYALHFSERQTLEGTVRVDGLPIAGTTLQAIRTGTDTVLAETRSDETGAFLLTGVLSGPVTLVASQTGYTFADPSPFSWDPLTEDKGDLQFLGTYAAAITGTLTNPQGHPVASAPIRVRSVPKKFSGTGGPFTSRQWLEYPLEIDTDVQVDTLTFHFHSNYANETFHLIHPNGTSIKITDYNYGLFNRPLTFRDGAPPSSALKQTFGPVDVSPAESLSAFSGLSARGTWIMRIYGVYPDAWGPFEIYDWGITIFPLTPGKSPIDSIVYSDGDGTFEASNLPPAFYELTPLSEQLFVSLDTSTLDLSLQSSQSVTGIAQLPQLTVSVTDTEGNPVHGATVLIERSDYADEVLTDANGLAVISFADKSTGLARVYIPDSHYGVPSQSTFDFSTNPNPGLSFVLHPRDTPQVSVLPPSIALTYPTAFSPDTVNATASVPGQFSYDTQPGTVLQAGTTVVGWTFTPDDLLRNAPLSGTFSLSVGQAQATLATDTLQRVFDGTPQPIAVTSLPNGLPVSITYPGNSVPVDAGTYEVRIDVTDPNYAGSLTVDLEIAKAPVQFIIAEALNGSIERRQDAPSNVPTVATVPEGLAVDVSFSNAPDAPAYGPSASVPVAIGNYLLTVWHDSPNYSGSLTLPYRVLPRAVSIQFDEAENGTIRRTYSGRVQEPVQLSTVPSEVELNVLYRGSSNNGTVYGPSPTPPTLAGTYTVEASVVHPDLEGSAQATLDILRAPFSVDMQGLPQQVSAGTLLDLESLLQSNATSLSVAGSADNTVSFRMLRETLSWGLSSALPDFVMDARPGYSGSGVALLPGGLLRVWNQNGTTLNEVPNTDALSSVSLDGYGDTYAYWLNYDGSLSLAATTFPSLIPSVGQIPEEARGRIRDMAVGNQHILTLTENGELLYFANYPQGDAFDQALGVIPPSIPTDGVVSIAAGEFHALIADDNGNVYTWGLNEQGQLNVPDFGNASVEHVFAGSGTSVAVLNDGRAVAWGGHVFDRSPAMGRRWVDVSVGGPNYVALLDDAGELAIMGYGPYQAQPSGLQDGKVFAIEAGPQSLFAFKRTAKVEPLTPGTLRLDVSHNDPHNLLPADPVSLAILITKKTASIELLEGDGTVVNRVYSDGAMAAPILQTLPSGLAYTLSYSGTTSDGTVYGPVASAPEESGSYVVEVNLADTVFAQTATFPIEIQPATATLSVLSDIAIYDGSAKVPSLATNPSGLEFTVQDTDGKPLQASMPGAYPFIATIEEPNYSGTLTGTFTIAKATDSLAHSLPDSIVFGEGPLALIGQASSGIAVGFEILSGPAKLDDNGALVATGVGPVIISLSTAGDTNYEAAFLTHLISVQAASASLTLRVPEGAVYNGGPYAADAQTVPHGLSVNLLYNGSAELPVEAGTYTVTASVNDPRYTASASAAFSIAKAPVLFFWDQLEHDFDGTEKEPTVRVEPENLGLNVSFSGPYAEGNPIYGGTYRYSVTASGPNHYGTSVADMTILPRPQTITFAPLQDMTYGDAPQSIVASLDSGRAVRSSIVSGPASIDESGRIVPIAAGTVTVRVEEALSAARDFAPAAAVERSFSVSRAQADITINLPFITTYTGDPIYATAYATESGTLNASEISLTYDGSPNPPSAPGSYAVIASGQNERYSGSASATLVITQAPATIQSTVSATYTGSAILPEVTTDPAGLAYSLTWESGSAPTEVGTYPYTIVINEPNYVGTREATLEILQAQATLSLDSTELSYTGGPLSVAITSTPANIAVDQSFYSGPSFNQLLGSSITSPGRYLLSATVADPNYFGSISAYVDIIRTAVAYSVDESGWVYDGLARLPAVSTVPTGVNVDWELTKSGQTVAEARDAGTYLYTVAALDSGFTGTSSGSFVIQPAPASITLTALNPVYNGSPQVPSSATSPEGLDVSFVFEQEGQPVSEATDAGVYSVSASVANSNYTGSATGTFEIARAEDAITWSDQTDLPVWQEHTLTASATSGKSVTYAIVDGSAHIDGNTLILTNAQPVTVQASVASSGNFLDAPPIQRVFTPQFTPASVSLANLEQVYSGAPRSVVAMSSPADLEVEILYDGSSTPPLNAGSYAITATIQTPGYLGGATAQLNVAKAAADVRIESPDTLYSGTPRVPTVSTSPADLALSMTLFNSSNEVISEAIGAGRYRILCAIDEANYEGSAEAEWEIVPAPASIVFDGETNGQIDQAYTGLAISPPAVTTIPSGLPVDYVFRDLLTGTDLGSNPPSERGLYRVTASVTDTNYTGTATSELLLGERAVSFSVAELTNGEVSRLFSNAPAVLPAITSSPADVPYRIQFLAEGASPDSTTSAYPTDSGRYLVRVEATQPYNIGSTSFILEILPEVGSASFTPPGDTSPGTAWDPLALVTTACAEYLSVEWLSGPVHLTTHALWGAEFPEEILALPTAALNKGIDAAELEYLQAAAVLHTGDLVYWGFYFNGEASGSRDAPYVDVAVGGLTMMALRADGTLQGFGSYAEATVPASIQGSVVDVAGGNAFYLALLQDGTLAQWGSDSNGDPMPAVPTLTEGLSWTAIDAQGNLAAGVDSAGTLHVWGDSPVTGALTPANAAGRIFLDVVLSSTGGIGLAQDGTLHAWGDAPASFPAFSGAIVDVALSIGHAHAVDANGQIYSWSASGAYADQTSHPVPVAEGPVRRVWASQNHVLATYEDGLYRSHGQGEARLRYTVANCPNTSDFTMEPVFRVGEFAPTLSFLNETEGAIRTRYTGQPQSVSLQTVPADLSISIQFTGTTASGTSYGPTSVPPTDAGTYTVLVTSLNSFHEGSASTTWHIQPADQSISFPSIAPFDVSNQPLLEATASSGLPVAFSVVSGPAALLNGRRLLCSSNEAVVVRATQTGNANFNGAAPVERTFYPQRRATIEWLDTEPVYNGSGWDAPSFTTNPANLNVAITYDGSSTLPTFAGAYAGVATVVEDHYYGSAQTNFFFHPKVTFSATEFIYSGARQGPSVTIEPFFNKQSRYYENETDLGALAPSAVGDYTYVVTPLGLGRDYRIPFRILKVPSSITFQDSSLVLGQNASLSALSTTFTSVTFEVVQGSAILNGSTINPQAPGPLVIRATASGTDNYEAPAPVERTFYPAYDEVAISVSNLSRVYTGHGLAPTVSEAEGIGYDLTFDGGFAYPVNVGTYPYEVTVRSVGKYGFSSGTFSITPKPETIALTSASYPFTGEAISPTFALSNPSLPYSIDITDGNGQPTSPVAAGTYTVTARITDPNHSGETTTTFVIEKATVTFFLPEAVNGEIHRPLTGSTATAPAITSNPNGIASIIEYRAGSGSWSLTPPTDRGHYEVRVTSGDPNYTGSTTADFIIGARQLTFSVPESVEGKLSATYSGSPYVLPSIEVTPTGAPYTVTFEGQSTDGTAYPASATPPTNSGSYTMRMAASDTLDRGSLVLNLEVLPAVPTLTFSPPTDLRIGQSFDPLSLLSAPCNEAVSVEILSGPVSNGTGIAWGDTADGLSTLPAALQGGFLAAHFGYNQGVAVTPSGSVVSWGAVNYTSAIASLNLPAVVDVAALGYDGQIALDVNGIFHIWGTAWNPVKEVPAAIQGRGVAIEAGYSVYLAKLDDGTLYQWGNDTDWSNPMPEALKDASGPGVVDFDIEYNVAAAVDGNGQVHVWGGNAYTNTSLFAVPDAAQSNVARVAVSSQGVLALKSDGTLVAWGITPSIPFGVDIDGRATEVELGTDYAHAIRDDGRLISWGQNVYLNYSLFPGLLADGSVEVTRIVAGNANAVAQYAGSIASITGPGDLALRFTLQNCPNYEDTVFEQTLRIGYDSLAVSFPAASSGTETRSYTGSPLAPVVTTSPDGVRLRYVYSGTTTVGDSYGPTAIPPTDAGLYSVTVSSDDPAWIGQGSVHFQIAPASQMLSSPTGTAFLVGQSIALPEFSSAGLPISYSLVSGPATLTGNLLEFTGKGSVEVFANQSGNGNFAAATGLSMSFTCRDTAQIEFLNLSQAYTGTPRSASIRTVPAGLNGEILYDGSPDIPIEVGTYTVSATINDPLWVGTASDTFTITRGQPDLSLANFSVTYTGADQLPEVITFPEGVPHALRITRDGEVVVPVDAGLYRVEITVDTPNYASSESLFYRIEPAPVEFSLSNLAQTYDYGNVLLPDVVASHPNVDPIVKFFKDGDVAQPTEAGEYSVLVTSGNVNFVGLAEGTMTVRPRAASLALVSSEGTYTGLPQWPAILSEPNGLALEWEFSKEGATVPSIVDAGFYSFTASITDPNFVGSLSGSFTLQPAAFTASLQDTVLSYTGTALEPGVMTDPLGVPLVRTYAQLLDSSPLPVAVDLPTLPGTYVVNLTSSSGNFVPALTQGQLTFIVDKATALIEAPALEVQYDGSSKSLVVSTQPDGIDIQVAYTRDGQPIESPTESGTYLATITASSELYFGRAHSSLTILPPAKVFGFWEELAELPPALKDPQSRNGPLQVPNILAYAMGFNPLLATADDLPQILKPAEGTAQGIEFRFRQVPSLEDYRIVVEFSYDLSTWIRYYDPSIRSVPDKGFDWIIVPVPDTLERAFFRTRIIESRR